jgi:hypothetical protein
MSSLSSRFGVQSYSPNADLDYESWAKDGVVLCEMHDLMPFAIGDWLNFGEQAYGQKYSQALSMTGLEYGTLVKYSMISKAFPEDRRRENAGDYRISWSHYRMLLGKSEEEQDKWLDACQANEMTVRELRASLPAASDGTNGPDPLVEFTKTLYSLIEQIPGRAVDLMKQGEGEFIDAVDYNHEGRDLRLEFQVRVVTNHQEQPSAPSE